MMTWRSIYVESGWIVLVDCWEVLGWLETFSIRWHQLLFLLACWWKFQGTRLGVRWIRKSYWFNNLDEGDDDDLMKKGGLGTMMKSRTQEGEDKGEQKNSEGKKTSLHRVPGWLWSRGKPGLGYRVGGRRQAGPGCTRLYLYSTYQKYVLQT